MKKIFVLFFVFSSISCLAQFSKTHYIPPVSHSDRQEPQEQVMYISSPSIIPINFQVKTPIGGTLFAGTVSRDAPYVYKIGSGNNTQFMIDKSDVNTIQNNKGFIVEAEDLVYVTVRVVATVERYQAGSIVSKGQAALGKQFRIGAFTNKDVTRTNDTHYTFATILATENTTTISFGDIKSGVSLINNATVGNTPTDIILNRGESFAIAVEGPNDANRDGLIGASINSDKPIVVNCGSFGGSNSTGNLDLGMDQIVSAERTGTEYIFIKGNGIDLVEKPIIVANENFTDVFLNGSATALTTLSAGQYVALNGADFSADGNLYVTTSKKAFAYQGIGGTSGPQNQNLHFVPPLNCGTPKIINNIPLINICGIDDSFIGTVCIVTKTNSTLNFIIDAVPYTLATLPSTNPATGPSDVNGNPGYKTYTISGLTGNVSVFSTSEVYLSYFGSSGAATYGGFYSGFTFDPEITFGTLSTTASGCIPNVNLSVNTLSSFDSFKWFKDGVFNGNTASSYTPTSPGYYYVSGQISACGSSSPPYNSVEIPVSSCPTNLDNDQANDNIDLDNDNDGISNCTESYGDQDVDISNLNGGNIAVSSYTNSYIGTLTTAGPGIPVGTFSGNTDGSFISVVPKGKRNSATYKMTFNEPISLGIEYVSAANPSDLLNADAEYVVNSDIDKTITVLNPIDQLLIDTNYDGIYESGITEFSSFEIRFRLNSTTALAAGTGTFKFLTYLTNSISFTHKNLSDDSPNKSSLKFFATCVPKDSDGDDVADQLDTDSDNDGIPDAIEAQGNNFIAYTSLDLNKDGLSDAYANGIVPVDTDLDFLIGGVPDYLDLDSDNDGIYDLVESGSNTIDANKDGIIDGLAVSFGTNGLFDGLETSPDSGQLNYTLTDTDTDGFYNYIDLDSDNDLCKDVIEAGFTDLDGDGKFGNSPVTVNLNGLVNGAPFTIPNPNYAIPAPIAITIQPTIAPTCELENASVSLVDNIGNTYQWQIFSGAIWTDIVDDTTYAGAKTNTLSITSVKSTMDGTKYRVQLNKTGNSCGLMSSETTLTVYALPVITTPISLIQCDDVDAAPDGIATFNLTQKNSFISADFAAEDFIYFTDPTAATSNDTTFLIPNPLAFISPNTSVWVRVENSNDCFIVARLDLIVSVTKLPNSFIIPNQHKCDDYVDATNNQYDGVASFDFTPIFNSIKAVLIGPTANYTIKFYKNINDFNAETDSNGNSLAISDITNYRNIDSPRQQTIWLRVDSTLDNSCFGNKTFTIIVEPTPVFNTVGLNNIIRNCDDDQDGIFAFDTSTLKRDILQGQSNVDLTYFDDLGVQLLPLPNPFFVNTTKTITVRMTNDPSLAFDGPCYYEKNITFIVDDKPEAFAIPAIDLTECDDEKDPADQNGLLEFNTSSIESDILQGQNGMQVTYTLENGTVLSTLGSTFTTRTQNVVVTVTNPLNPSCPATTTLNFKVNPLPKINLNAYGDEDELVCSNDPTFFVQLNVGIQDGSPTSNYTYIWSKDGTVLSGEIDDTLDVNAEGSYSVEVFNSSGCSRIRTIKVTASDVATIQTIDIVDMSDVNTVTVNVTGAGDYEYSLDESSGYFQDSNFFDNVPAGIHDVYINDKNGCRPVTKATIAVVGLPKFFTPNSDGYNDYWSPKGVNASFNSKSTIYIFDRYGKLLKQWVPSTSEGWDGTFNGNPLPADDYWYTVKLEDGREAKGHFSLKR